LALGGGGVAALHWPEGSVLPSVMDLPEGVVPALRVPLRVKGWLRAGVALEVVMVMVWWGEGAEP